MLRSKKFAGFFLFLTLIGSTAVFAQAPQLPQQQQQQKVEVSDAELNKFANAFQGIRMVNQEAQQEMTQVIQEEGMEIQRFNELFEASANPQVEVEATGEEEKQFEAISSELEGMQGAFQAKMEKIITDEGLSIERYEQIAMGLQADPALQERLRAVFEG